MCTPMSKTDSQWEPTLKHRKLSLPFGDELEEWDGEGNEGLKREGMYAYIWLIQFMVQQKENHGTKQ